MKYCFNNIELKSIQVTNKLGTPGIVILLPVTRENPESRLKWEKAIRIAEASKAKSLVILDKTPLSSATDFFFENRYQDFLDVYIIKRFPKEAIYDSQGILTLDENLWILQLHDDDEWDGALNLPSDPQDRFMYTPKFYMTENGKSQERVWAESPPARINFTLIPNRVWNKFTEFIRLQGGHVAGSADSTLNTMARLNCEQAELLTFSYHYDTHNWTQKNHSKNHLKELAFQDGWEDLSSPEIAVLNRTIDAITALYFISESIDSASFTKSQSEILREFQVSPKKLMVIWIRRLPLLVTVSLLNQIQKQSSRERGRDSITYKLNSRLKVDGILISSDKVKSVKDVIGLIDILARAGNRKLLRKRFAAWHRILEPILKSLD